MTRVKAGRRFPTPLARPGYDGEVTDPLIDALGARLRDRLDPSALVAALVAAGATVTGADAGVALGVAPATARRWVEALRQERGTPADAGEITVAELLDVARAHLGAGDGGEGDEGITGSEAARRMDVSTQRVSQLVQAGRLRRLPSGRLSAASVEEEVARRRAAGAAVAPPVDETTVDEARALAASLDGIERAVVEARYSLDERHPSHRRTTDQVSHRLGLAPATVADVLRVVGERVGGLPGEPTPTRRRTRQR